MKTKIKNGRVIRDGKIRSENVCFENEKIIADGEDSLFDRIVDANGNYVSPGFIDIHVHGGGGYDFNDATEEAFFGAAAFHAKHGTCAMLPTCTSASVEELLKVFEVYRHVKDRENDGASLLGLHLEGPYFSKSQVGAQDTTYIHPPVKEEYERILDACPDIRRWSAAPELDEGFGFAEAVTKRGILLSAGHTDADCREMLNAADHGYTHMTHLYSCMRSVVRENGIRKAGAVEAAYLDDRITVELIADGMHLPKELLKMVYKIKGPDRIALITDAMRGAGMPEGTHSILGSLKNGLDCILRDGVAWLPDGQAFAGSVATTDRLVRTMYQTAGIPLTDAVKMASETPANLIGCREKGTLDIGRDADILIFDENVEMQKVFVLGKEINLG